MENIVLNNVTYEFVTTDENEKENRWVALKNINLHINEGEFLCVIGKNGSGKSTLGKLINGLYLPTVGDITVYGMNTKIESNILDIRKNVGMVFQNPDNQIVASIVEEDVAFGLENLGVSTDEMRVRVKKVLTDLNLEKYRHYSPNKLSGGQKQKLALAGILAMKPKVIVFDEPTAMLDPIGRKELIDTIVKLNKEEKITIILITHFMEEIVDSDRVIVMNQGEIVGEYTPKEVFNEVDISKYGIIPPKIIAIKNELVKNGINIKNDIMNVKNLVDEL